MNWAQAGIYAGAFFGGSVWALLLALLIWRVHPFGPARAAISECYRQLGDAGTRHARLVRRETSVEEWEAHARAHRRAVRDAIEQARSAMQGTVRWRGTVTPRLAQGLLRVEAVDQIFGALIAMSELLENADDPALLAAADRVLRLTAPALVLLGSAARTDRMLPESRLDRVAERLRVVADELPRLQPIVDALIERLRIAVTMSTKRALAPNSRWKARRRCRCARGCSGRSSRISDWHSATFRHALRTSVVAAPAFAFTLPHYHGYEHWLTITLVMTMQPFFALTWQRAIERVGGTVLGGLAAAALAILCTTPFSIALALFPLLTLAFALRQVSFGAFIAGITPVVVLLSELGAHRHERDHHRAVPRALHLVGGLMAVAGVVFLWPSWEPDRLRSSSAARSRRMRAMPTRCSRALRRRERGHGGGAARGRAREQQSRDRDLARAAGNRQASAAAAAEPDRLEAAMLVDAALRRMAGRLAALSLAARSAAGMARRNGPNGAAGSRRRSPGCKRCRRWRRGGRAAGRPIRSRASGGRSS